MAAACHRDRVSAGAAARAGWPRGLSMLGSPVDLCRHLLCLHRRRRRDHICHVGSHLPSARLLGSKYTRFRVSTSGHIAAL